MKVSSAQKKFFLALFVVPLFFGIYSNSASAVVIVPATGSYALGSTVTYNILSDYSGLGIPSTDNVRGIALRLTIEGGTITGYTDPSGLTAYAACTGDVKFTSTSICVDIVTLGDSIANGVSLGSFTVNWPTAGITTITRAAGNIYKVNVDPIVSYGQTGTIGTYTIGAPDLTPTITTTGVLPRTAIDIPDNYKGGILIAMGLIFIVGGSIFFLRSSKKVEKA